MVYEALESLRIFMCGSDRQCDKEIGMRIYKYYNYDIYDLTSEEEIDLNGDTYYKLIKLCCEKCNVLSFSIEFPNICSPKMKNNLKKYEIQNPYDTDSDEDSSVHYYRVCPELCQLLIESVSSMFAWIGYIMPEDPTFYRPDGSIFFTSTTHEGELTLMPRGDEDISEILSGNNWFDETAK